MKVRMFSKLDQNITEIIVKSLASVAIRIVGLIFGLTLSIYLGNTYGPETVGIFSLSSKIQEFLTIIGMLGIGEILMKEVAIFKGKEDFKSLNLFIQNSFILIMIFSFLLLVVFYGLTDYISIHIFNKETLSKYLKIFTVIAFLKINISIFSQILKGLKHTWQGNAIRDTFPIVALVLIGIGLIGFKIPFNFYEICIGFAFCHGIILLYAIALILKRVPNFQLFRTFRIEIYKRILKDSFPLLIVGSFVLINSFVDIVMITMLSDLEQVGLYAVASRIAFLINFFLIMSGTILAPKIASFYSEGRLEKLKETISFASKAYFIIGIISISTYLVFGNQILSFWGEKFSKSYILLIILSIGYFFNLIFGLSTFMLSMTGNQKVLGKISIIFGIINMVLNFILIKSYGALGAAIATSITLILESLFKAYFAKKTIGISPIFINN